MHHMRANGFNQFVTDCGISVKGHKYCSKAHVHHYALESAAGCPPETHETHETHETLSLESATGCPPIASHALIARLRVPLPPDRPALSTRQLGPALPT